LTVFLFRPSMPQHRIDTNRGSELRGVEAVCQGQYQLIEAHRETQGRLHLLPNACLREEICCVSYDDSLTRHLG